MYLPFLFQVLGLQRLDVYLIIFVIFCQGIDLFLLSTDMCLHLFDFFPHCINWRRVQCRANGEPHNQI